ncbi:hypothetical protein NXS19_008781 [Fusarium pseudograminearum]|nr:hypothetical protein NXS19_008781 [Fusarium pseudograminearum]
MGVGSFLEPLVVVTLLFGGAYFNRSKDYNFWTNKSGFASLKSYKRSDDLPKRDSTESLMSGWSGSRSPTLDSHKNAQSSLRRRKLQVFGYKRIVSTPNTQVFEDRLLSRLLKKLPFLVECWYWFLIYFVYQVGRAITALTLDEGSVDVARRHALQIIHLEQRLHIFWEESTFKNGSLLGQLFFIGSTASTPSSIFPVLSCSWWCYTTSQQLAIAALLLVVCVTTT